MISPREANGSKTENENFSRDHYYCYYKGNQNDGVYNRIDRSDEDDLFITTRVEDTDFSVIEPCDDVHVKCGSKCLPNYRWCNGDIQPTETCEYHTKDRNITINIFDELLCGAKEVWRDMPCDSKEQGGIHGAPRCNGTIQHCLRPWYAVPNGIPSIGFKQRCLDKSDQIFDIGAQCNASYYLKIHNDKFCNSNYTANQEDICVKPNEWLARQTKEEYADPHNCQASCLEPGPGCEACTRVSLYTGTGNNVPRLVTNLTDFFEENKEFLMI